MEMSGYYDIVMADLMLKLGDRKIVCSKPVSLPSPQKKNSEKNPTLES